MLEVKWKNIIAKLNVLDSFTNAGYGVLLYFVIYPDLMRICCVLISSFASGCRIIRFGALDMTDMNLISAKKVFLVRDIKGVRVEITQ